MIQGSLYCLNRLEEMMSTSCTKTSHVHPLSDFESLFVSHSIISILSIKIKIFDFGVCQRISKCRWFG